MVQRAKGKIKEMYAFVMEKDGNETVIADIYQTPAGQMMAPIVFHSKALIPEAREKAITQAKERGLTVKLLKFTNIEVVEMHQHDKGLIIV